MELRAIKPEEYPEALRLMGLCFRFDEREYRANDTGCRHEGMCGAFGDDGAMTSLVVNNPYQAAYWGRWVGMSGVGGVATLPQYRREGHIRALMNYALRSAYDRGDWIAALYPFSHPFYRKFGFENGQPVDTCIIQNEALQAFAPIGTVTQYLPGQDDAALRAVYLRYAAGRNLACARTEDMWQNRLRHDPWRDHVYTYLWATDEGEPQGYLTVRHELTDGVKWFRVTDWAYATPQALRGLMGALKLLAPSGKRVELRLPPEVDPFLLFPEPLAVQVRRGPGGMARVLRVEECLRHHPWPEGFRLRVQAEDPVLVENNAVFELECRHGETAVRRVTGEPDVAASIQALSVLLLGVADWPRVQLNHADACRVSHHVPGLEAAFPAHPHSLREMF